MFEPISNTEKERLMTSGVVSFRTSDQKAARTMGELPGWETCEYNVYYSAKSDNLMHIFVCDITVTQNLVMIRSIRLPKGSDLGKDEPILVAMAECMLKKALKWVAGIDKKRLMVDSCLPHFNVALKNAGFVPMRTGSLESDTNETWHRGRKLLVGKDEL